jgi:hypothetical protein
VHAFGDIGDDRLRGQQNNQANPKKLKDQRHQIAEYYTILKYYVALY